METSDNRFEEPFLFMQLDTTTPVGSVLEDSGSPGLKMECAGDEFDLDIEKGWNECAGDNHVTNVDQSEYQILSSR